MVDVTRLSLSLFLIAVVLSILAEVEIEESCPSRRRVARGTWWRLSTREMASRERRWKGWMYSDDAIKSVFSAGSQRRSSGC